MFDFLKNRFTKTQTKVIGSIAIVAVVFSPIFLGYATEPTFAKLMLSMMISVVILLVVIVLSVADAISALVSTTALISTAVLIATVMPLPGFWGIAHFIAVVGAIAPVIFWNNHVVKNWNS